MISLKKVFFLTALLTASSLLFCSTITIINDTSNTMKISVTYDGCQNLDFEIACKTKQNLKNGPYCIVSITAYGIGGPLKGQSCTYQVTKTRSCSDNFNLSFKDNGAGSLICESTEHNN